MNEKSLKVIDDVAQFMWRDRNGKFHAPGQMETRHLFYTLRMIWNHSAPKELQIAPFKKYSFSPFYTPEYIIRAVKELSKELGKRKDIHQYESDLRHMINHMKLLIR